MEQAALKHHRSPQGNSVLVLAARMILVTLTAPSFPIALVILIGLAVGPVIGEGGSLGLTVLMLGMFVLGPFVLTLLLSPTWRGAGIAVLATLGMLLGFSLGGLFTEWLPYSLAKSLALASAAALAAAIATTLTGYARDQDGVMGIVSGVVVGTGMTIMFILLPGPWQYSAPLDLPDPPVVIEWAAPLAFVWTSSVFFPALFRRRAGWAGSAIWAGLQVSIFAAGVLGNEVWVG